MTNEPLYKALRLTLSGLIDQMPVVDEEYDQGFEGDDTSFYHLIWMANRCLENMEEWPIDKTNRWIGYIQGVLTCRGEMDPSKERDRTRPFFHEAYEEMGLKKPATAERKPGKTQETSIEDSDTNIEDWYFQTPDE